MADKIKIKWSKAMDWDGIIKNEIRLHIYPVVFHIKKKSIKTIIKRLQQIDKIVNKG